MKVLGAPPFLVLGSLQKAQAQVSLHVLRIHLERFAEQLLGLAVSTLLTQDERQQVQRLWQGTVLIQEGSQALVSPISGIDIVMRLPST